MKHGETSRNENWVGTRPFQKGSGKKGQGERGPSSFNPLGRPTDGEGRCICRGMGGPTKRKRKESEGLEDSIQERELNNSKGKGRL